MVIDIDDEDSQRLLRLFNDPAGLQYLKEEAGVDGETLSKLSWLGISGIANVLCCIKMAKYYEMTERTWCAPSSPTRPPCTAAIRELADQYGPYDAKAAAVDHHLHLLGLRTDSMAELGYRDRKRIHNLKYYTWVEQQGRTMAEINDLWYDEDKTWKGVHCQAEALDERIDAFNEAAGVLKSL
jgi:hypothetical protein